MRRPAKPPLNPRAAGAPLRFSKLLFILGLSGIFRDQTGSKCEILANFRDPDAMRCARPECRSRYHRTPAPPPALQPRGEAHVVVIRRPAEGVPHLAKGVLKRRRCVAVLAWRHVRRGACEHQRPEAVGVAVRVALGDEAQQPAGSNNALRFVQIRTQGHVAGGNSELAILEARFACAGDECSLRGASRPDRLERPRYR